MTAILFPECLTAGDDWSVDLASTAGIAPPDWSVSVVLTPEGGGAPVPLAATDVAGTWVLQVSPAASGAVAAGNHSWAALAVKGDGTGRRTLARGAVQVRPDPATSTADTRTPAERILAAIVATIEGRATKDADSYTIEGRSIGRTPMADLLRLKGHYEGVVRAERQAAAGIAPSPFALRRWEVRQ